MKIDIQDLVDEFYCAPASDKGQTPIRMDINWGAVSKLALNFQEDVKQYSISIYHGEPEPTRLHFPPETEQGAAEKCYDYLKKRL